MNGLHSPSRALVRLLAFLGLTLLMLPPYAALLAVGLLPLCRQVARCYWRMVVAALGFRIVVRGEAVGGGPVLLVANHVSYFDIVVLGSLVQGAFVAKKEVSQWPGFGTLAKLGRTVFVDRLPRKSLHQRDEMIARLAAGAEPLVLFPEGTRSEGSRALPFKSALFSVAELTLADGRPLPVQPVSLAYTRLDGMPMGRIWRPFFAWYGDMELVPHLWEALGVGRPTIEVSFHPAVTLAQFGSRKALADHCHGVIHRAVVQANNGLPATPPAPPAALPAEAAAG